MITILVATVAVAMHLLTEMNNFGETPVPWRTLWFSALTLAVYVLRDGFVLQWFTGSRMKLPLIKGSAVLAAYYLLAALVSFSGGFMRWGPMGGPPSWRVTGVLVVQLAAGVAVGRMIAVRYANRPIVSSAESHPATLVSSS